MTGSPTARTAPPAPPAATGGALKDHFDGRTARLLGSQIRAVHPAFDVDGYVAHVERHVPDQELKGRVLTMAAGLRDRLPRAYPEALAVLVASLRAGPGETLGEDGGMFNEGWHLMPVARFVEEYGLDDPDRSLDAMPEITRRHTAEFTVRPFLEQHYDRTLERLRTWAHDPDLHVRRLVSEGTRPRLPWARRLRRFVDDPAPVLDLLEPLRDDPALYVRRSVANSLNDIAKDHPDLALGTARRWSDESPTAGTSWIVRHALRTLVKQGHPDALALTGATGGEHIQVGQFTLTPEALTLGGSVQLRMELLNTDARRHRVTVDFLVHHVRRNGATSPKVFKFATVELNGGEGRTLTKVHHVRPVSTRTYHSGPHRVDIQVNGRVLATATFHLDVQ